MCRAAAGYSQVMTESTSGAARGVAQALNALTEQTSSLVRQEVASAQGELLDKLKANLPAAGMLGASGVLGTLAVASSHRWVLAVLERRLPPASAAFVALLGYGAAAGGAAVVGAGWLKAAPVPVPSETARDVTGVVAGAASDARGTSAGA